RRISFVQCAITVFVSSARRDTPWRSQKSSSRIYVAIFSYEPISVRNGHICGIVIPEMGTVLARATKGFKSRKCVLSGCEIDDFRGRLTGPPHRSAQLARLPVNSILRRTWHFERNVNNSGMGAGAVGLPSGTTGAVWDSICRKNIRGQPA